jgi:hypothetical protein
MTRKTKHIRLTRDELTVIERQAAQMLAPLAPFEDGLEYRAPGPIENTRERDPPIHLFGMVAAGPEKYLQDMQAGGQRQLAKSSQIPRDTRGITKEQLTELGFEFPETNRAPDDLFMDATLPAGWSLKPDEGGSYWTYILDTNGLRRFMIFYKAAYYDRSAFMKQLSRFMIRKDYDLSNTDGHFHLYIEGQLPNGEAKEVYRSRSSEPYNTDWDARDAMEARERASAWAWLRANYPEETEWEVVL